MPGQVKANVDDKANPQRVVKVIPKKDAIPKDMSPDKIYQEALAKGETDPGQIIAVVDFMVQ